MRYQFYRRHAYWLPPHLEQQTSLDDQHQATIEYLARQRPIPQDAVILPVINKEVSA